MKDLIIEETRQARDAHAKQFNYNLDAICDDLRQREKESAVPTVTLLSQTFRDQEEGPAKMYLTPFRFQITRFQIPFIALSLARSLPCHFQCTPVPRDRQVPLSQVTPYRTRNSENSRLFPLTCLTCVGYHI
ncbi:MAG: hypothetical protein ABFD90_00830 [Phycisphaerales bacterium]